MGRVHMDRFLSTAEMRNTSRKIMEAIGLLGTDESESELVRIWEEPTCDEKYFVLNKVTKDGSSPDDYSWGAAGERWADNLPPEDDL